MNWETTYYDEKKQMKASINLNDPFSLYNDQGDRYSDMQCPKCSTEMMLKQKNETSIDYCPSCGGVWLDRGEIDKIIQIQSSDEDEHYNKYHYRNGDYDDYYYNNKYGRRGFFGDLFNF